MSIIDKIFGKKNEKKTAGKDPHAGHSHAPGEHHAHDGHDHGKKGGHEGHKH